MNKVLLRKQLIDHESKKLQSYICPAGYLTVGIGRNLEANPATEELGRSIDRPGISITDDEAMLLLDHDIEKFTKEVRAKIPKFDQISEPRQHVIIDMAFNLGTNGLLKFRRMLAAIRAGDFNKAADEMLDSKWADDVKERRCGRLAMMMRDNKTFEEVESIIV